MLCSSTQHQIVPADGVLFKARSVGMPQRRPDALPRALFLFSYAKYPYSWSHIVSLVFNDEFIPGTKCMVDGIHKPEV